MKWLLLLSLNAWAGRVSNSVLDLRPVEEVQEELQDLSQDPWASAESYHRFLREKPKRLYALREKLLSFLETSNLAESWTDYQKRNSKTKEDPSRPVLSHPLLRQVALEYLGYALVHTGNDHWGLELSKKRDCRPVHQALTFIHQLEWPTSPLEGYAIERLSSVLVFYHVFRHYTQEEHEHPCGVGDEWTVGGSSVKVFPKVQNGHDPHALPLFVRILMGATSDFENYWTAVIEGVGRVESIAGRFPPLGVRDAQWVELYVPSVKPVKDLASAGDSLRVWSRRVEKR